MSVRMCVRIRGIGRSGHDASHMREIKLASDGSVIDPLDLCRAFGHLLVRMTVLLQCVDAVLDFRTTEFGEEKTGVDTADVHHCRV